MPSQITLDGPDETAALAAALAPYFRAGDTLVLDGELAAGKTTFVKALVAALGSTDPVTSPTYALVHVYGAPAFRIIHVDAYRIKSPAEYQDLGLDEYADDALTIIEWGERVEIEHDRKLSLRFAFVDGSATERRVTLDVHGPGWPSAAELQAKIESRQ